MTDVIRYPGKFALISSEKKVSRFCKQKTETAVPSWKQKTETAEEVIHGKRNRVARDFLFNFRHGKQIISLQLKVWILRLIDISAFEQ